MTDPKSGVPIPVLNDDTKEDGYERHDRRGPAQGVTHRRGIDGSEAELAKLKVRAARHQVDEPLTWATRFKQRTWAIESAGELDFLLSEQLLAAGEQVVDVPASLAAASELHAGA